LKVAYKYAEANYKKSQQAQHQSPAADNLLREFLDVSIGHAFRLFILDKIVALRFGRVGDSASGKLKSDSSLMNSVWCHCRLLNRCKLEFMFISMQAMTTKMNAV
jgi:hypothetical protein